MFRRFWTFLDVFWTLFDAFDVGEAEMGLMFKIELENRDFRKSLYFYKVDAEKKKKRDAGACQRPDIYYIYLISS